MSVKSCGRPDCPYCAGVGHYPKGHAEGARLSPDPGVLEVGLNGPTVSRLLVEDPGRWPLFARARKTPSRAHNTKIEWLVNESKRCDMGHLHPHTSFDFNYTQIFRTKASRASMTALRSDISPVQFALESLLDQIECALRDGSRVYDTSGASPIATMGGVHDLLGRWPRKGDRLELHILRDLVRRNELDRDSTEWIVELSLLATKGS